MIRAMAGPHGLAALVPKGDGHNAERFPTASRHAFRSLLEERSSLWSKLSGGSDLSLVDVSQALLLFLVDQKRPHNLCGSRENPHAVFMHNHFRRRICPCFKELPSFEYPVLTAM